MALAPGKTLAHLRQKMQAEQQAQQQDSKAADESDKDSAMQVDAPEAAATPPAAAAAAPGQGTVSPAVGPKHRGKVLQGLRPPSQTQDSSPQPAAQRAEQQQDEQLQQHASTPAAQTTNADGAHHVKAIPTQASTAAAAPAPAPAPPRRSADYKPPYTPHTASYAQGRPHVPRQAAPQMPPAEMEPQSGALRVDAHAQKVRSLLQDIDPRYSFEPGVEELLLQMTDDFVQSVVAHSAQLAQHRGSRTLDVSDMQLCLRKNFGIGWLGVGQQPPMDARVLPSSVQKAALIAPQHIAKRDLKKPAPKQKAPKKAKANTTPTPS